MDFFIWSYTEQGLVISNMPYSKYLIFITSFCRDCIYAIKYICFLFNLQIMRSCITTFSGYWVYEVKYPHFLKPWWIFLILLVGIEFMKYNTHTFLLCVSWTVLPDSEFLKWPNSFWNEQIGQFFLLFSINKNKCVSCLLL